MANSLTVCCQNRSVVRRPRNADQFCIQFRQPLPFACHDHERDTEVERRGKDLRCLQRGRGLSRRQYISCPRSRSSEDRRLFLRFCTNDGHIPSNASRSATGCTFRFAYLLSTLRETQPRQGSCRVHPQMSTARAFHSNRQCSRFRDGLRAFGLEAEPRRLCGSLPIAEPNAQELRRNGDRVHRLGTCLKETIVAATCHQIVSSTPVNATYANAIRQDQLFAAKKGPSFVEVSTETTAVT